MNVVMYRRISTDENRQKHSLSAQSDILRRDIERMSGAVIVADIQDDISASGFDRPGWSQLEAFCKKKTNNVRSVYVTEWTRFSRDLFGAIQMIERFRTMGIEINATNQLIDYNDPNYALMLAIHLGQGHAFRIKLSQDIKKSIVRAKQDGYWPNNSPYGYDNFKINKKGSLIPNEDSKFVVEAFNIVATGNYSMEEARKLMVNKHNGKFKMSKNAFARMLRKIVYAGYVEYESEFFAGKHDSVIDVTLFWHVQEILEPTSRVGAEIKLQNPDFPLRGFLTCSSDHKPLRASKSRGKLGKRYAYYHCSGKCSERFRADIAHEELVNLLKGYRIKMGHDEIIRKAFHSVWKQYKGDGQKEMFKVQREIDQINRMIKSVQDKYFTGMLEDQEYKEVKSRYQGRLGTLEYELEILRQLDGDFNEKLTFFVDFLQNLPVMFENSGIEVQKSILGSIFSEKLVFDGKEYRTPNVNPAIHLLCKSNKGYRGEVKRAEHLNDDQPSTVIWLGLEPRTLSLKGRCSTS